MNYLALTIAIYGTMVLQTSSCFSAVPLPIRMSGLIAIAVAVGSRMPNWRGVVLAAAIGLLSDLLSPGRIGIEMALATLMAFAFQLSKTESDRHLLRLAGTTFVGVFLIRLIATTIDQMDVGLSADPVTVATRTLLAAAFFAVVMPSIYGAWKFVIRLVGGSSLPESSTPTDRWLASSG